MHNPDVIGATVLRRRRR